MTMAVVCRCFIRALSLLFGPCRLSEFTLAGPQLGTVSKDHTGNTVPTWAKIITYFRIKNLKNATLYRGTCLYSPYMEVPPPPGQWPYNILASLIFIRLYSTFQNPECSLWHSLLIFWTPQGSVLGPLLYSLYTSPLMDIARSYGLSNHFCANDTQLYLSFETSFAEYLSICKSTTEDCARDIDLWMLTNKLNLNSEITEGLFIFVLLSSASCFE